MRDLGKKPQNHLLLTSDQEGEESLDGFPEQSIGAMEEEELFGNQLEQPEEFETSEYCAFSLRSSPFGFDESPRLRYLLDLDEGKSSFELFASNDGSPHQDSRGMMEEELPHPCHPKPQTDGKKPLFSASPDCADFRMEMLDSCGLSFQEELLSERSQALSTKEVSTNHSKPSGKSIRIYIEIPDEIFSQYGAAKDPESCPKRPFISEEKNFCSCSRSRCLKLYCQCFRRGVVCGFDCRCRDCENTVQNEEKIRELREPKVSRLQEEDSCCNCKMSFCEKSYCVCARSGKGCSKKCRCFNCKNPNGRPKRY